MSRGDRDPAPRRWRIVGAVGAVAWAALIFTLSSQSEVAAAGWIDLPFEDLIAHAVLYAVLAASLRLAGAPVGLAVVLATLYGVSDEIHQRFVPGRTPSWADLAADLVGAAVGAALLPRAAVAIFGRRWDDRRIE